jgi:UDP-glucose 4-epimerase
MRFVLLGGAGYVGGRVVPYLRSQGHHVRVTTRRPLAEVPSWLSADEIIQTDLVDESSLRSALADRDVAIHLAAPDEIAAAARPLEALRAGSELVLNTLTALTKCSPPPVFLYLSTFHVYGRNGRGDVGEGTLPLPSHPYAIGHYVGEQVTQMFRGQHAVEALCIRMSNAFGAPASIDVPRWSLVFNDLCLQAAVHKRLVLKTAGTQRRNFLTVHDAARAMEFLSARSDAWPADGILQLGSSMNLSIREVADRVAAAATEVCGVTPPIAAPGGETPVAEKELSFHTDRLAAMGFTWTNSMDAEIRATLELCREGERRWGSALVSRCRPDLARVAG